MDPVLKFVPVAQRTERQPPELKMCVRFAPGTHKFSTGQVPHNPQYWDRSMPRSFAESEYFGVQLGVGTSLMLWIYCG